MDQLRITIHDKDIELRIMKREKDESLNSRLDLALENKRLKVCLNDC